MSSNSGSDSDLSQGECSLERILEGKTKSQTTQTSSSTGDEGQTSNVELNRLCEKCWMLDLVDTEDCQRELFRRFCPNCNEVVYVCSKHERCYSPHGITCAIEGQRVIKRPYLRKRRRAIVIVESNSKRRK